MLRLESSTWMPWRFSKSSSSSTPASRATFETSRPHGPTWATAITSANRTKPSIDERNNAERAHEEFETAVRTYDRLRPDPDSTPRIATERALCFRQLSKIERRLGRFESALNFAAREVDDLKSVVRFHPGIADCHARLAEAYENLATTRAQGRLLQLALGAHVQAESEIAESLRLSPDNRRFQSIQSGIKHNHEVTSKRMNASTGAAAGNERPSQP